MISKFVDGMICPACANEKMEYIYEKLGVLGSLLKCTECSLCFIWPNLFSTGNAQVYDKRYYDKLGYASLSVMKQATFEHLFNTITVYKQEGKLLDIGCAFGDLLSVAAKRGWECFGIEISSYAAVEAGKKIGPESIQEGDFLRSTYSPETFDAVIMADIAEHIYETKALFQKCHDILKENSLLIIVTPDINSFSRKAMGRSWPHFNREHLVYFSGTSIARILSTNGFELLEAVSFKKAFNLYYIIAQLSMIEKAAFLRYLVRALNVLLPRFIKKKNFFVPHGEMLIVARKKAG